MKHLLPVLFSFLSIVAFGQVTVVVNPGDTIVCYRDSVAFTAVVTGAGAAKISYRWQKNYIDITGPGATDSIYAFAHVVSTSPGIYRCIVSVTGLGSDTSNDAILRMHPRMYIDTLYRYNPLGCPTVTVEETINGKKVKITKPLCKGQFTTSVSGGTQFVNFPHYKYDWNGGQTLDDTLVTGLCPGSYKLVVTDSLGCSIDSTYFVDVLKLPKVTFEVMPDSIIYLTNPNIEVAFPDSMYKHIENWTWDFGDSIQVPKLNPLSHTYSDTTKPGRILIKLLFTDLNGCDTTITKYVTVKIAELDIPNLFTPNGDGVNEKFAIQLMDDKEKDFREAYLGNELLVFDRWGKKVFNATNYKSEDWDGERLSDGTYFYILKCTGQFGEDVFKGSVTILR